MSGPEPGSDGVVDKIDLSLDDIIRLNREEERRRNGGYYPNMNGWYRPSGSRWGFQQQKGFGRGRYGYQGRGMSGRRRPYRVKTGLAAWKASNFRKGYIQRPLYRRSLTPQRSPEWSKPLPGLQWPLPRRLQPHRLDFFGSSQPFWLMDSLSPPISYNGYKYDDKYDDDYDDKYDKYNDKYDDKYDDKYSDKYSDKYDEERESRQATFLSRRGVEVESESETDQSEPRQSPWRTSTTSGGILTVSIENPAALELTVNAAPRLSRPILPPFLIKDPSEQKAPKGVPLQFDLNSIAKQTGITLNERFRILKEQRFTLSPSKTSRFVTVG